MTQKGRHTTHKIKIKRKQSNAWPVYCQHRQLICEEETFLRESRGELRADTESEITAAQDHATKILQTETDRKCGLCLQFDERVDHIITA